MKKKKIRYCPACDSINVNIAIGPSAVLGAPQQWRCNNCGFEAFAIFPEKEVGEEKEKNDKHKRKTWNKE